MTFTPQTMQMILKSVETGDFDIKIASMSDCVPEAIAHGLNFLLRKHCSTGALSLFRVMCRNYRKHHCYSSNARTAFETQTLLRKIIHDTSPCRDVVLLTRGAYKHACDDANRTTVLKKDVKTVHGRHKEVLQVARRSNEWKRLMEVLRQTDFEYCGLQNASEQSIGAELKMLFDNICVLRNCYSIVQTDQTIGDKSNRSSSSSSSNSNNKENEKDQPMDVDDECEEQKNNLLLETCALVLTLWYARGKHHKLQSLVWSVLEICAMYADTVISEFGKLPRHNRWLQVVRVVQDAQSLLDYEKDLFLVYTVLLLTCGRDVDVCLANETKTNAIFARYAVSSLSNSSPAQSASSSRDDNDIVPVSGDQDDPIRTDDVSDVAEKKGIGGTSEWLEERFGDLPDPDTSRSVLSNLVIAAQTSLSDASKARLAKRQSSKAKRGKKRKMDASSVEETENNTVSTLESENDDEEESQSTEEYLDAEADDKNGKKRDKEDNNNVRISFAIARRRKKYKDLPVQNEDGVYASQWFERVGLLEANNRGVVQTFVCTLRDDAAHTFGHRSAIVFGPFENRQQSRNVVFCHRLRKEINLPDILPVPETCLETTLRADIYNRGALDFDVALNYVLLSVDKDLRPAVLSLQLVSVRSLSQSSNRPALVANQEDDQGEWLSSRGVRNVESSQNDEQKDENRERADWMCRPSLNGASVFTRHQMAAQANTQSIVLVFVTFAWRFMLGMSKNTSQRTILRTGPQFDGRAVLDHWDIFNDAKSKDQFFHRKQSSLFASQMDQFLQERENREAILSALIRLRTRFSSDEVVALFADGTLSSRISTASHKSASDRLQLLIERLEAAEPEHSSMGGTMQMDLEDRAETRQFWSSFF